MEARKITHLKNKWNSFFFSDHKLFLSGFIRIVYAILLLINLTILAIDLDLWFSESGLLSLHTSQLFIGKGTWSLLNYLPSGSEKVCFILFYLQSLLLLIGYHSKLQTYCVFIWLCSFQHRNIIIFDGEDTVFRLFAFFLMFVPVGYNLSIDSLQNKAKVKPESWGIRLIQIEMTIIYLSTFVQKVSGDDWQLGHALYYISYLDDLFGRFPLPDFFLNSLLLMKLFTWFVLCFELVLPIALWHKKTRFIALCCGILFHLSIDYTMNLFLFQWIMVLGLLTFLKEEDFKKVRK